MQLSHFFTATKTCPSDDVTKVEKDLVTQ